MELDEVARQAAVNGTKEAFNYYKKLLRTIFELPEAA